MRGAARAALDHLRHVARRDQCRATAASVVGTSSTIKTRNGKVSGGFLYKTVNRITLKSLAYDLEPEKVELVDQPEVDKDAIRVCGPFEVMSLGRYSVEDWKGYVVREPGIGEAAKLENYIEVICRLYRKDAAIQGATGLVHAVAETEKEKIAISVGPLSGRVTGKQINDAVQDALASGILEVHVLGWAFEANVGEVKSQLEKRGKVKVELIMIRPDTLAEGLKATQPEMLFSPLALPDIEVEVAKNGKEKRAARHAQRRRALRPQAPHHRVQGGRLGLRLGVVPRRGLRRRLLRGLPDVLRLQEDAEHQGRAQGRGGPGGVHAQARPRSRSRCAATSASR